jgi:hypothetical protein
MIFARWARKGRKEKTAIEQIETAENHLLSVPWKGSPCMVMVRELSDIQIQTIGSLSLIETDEYKWSKAQVKTTWAERLSYADKMVAICKAALVSPSYDEIFATIGKNAFNAEVKAQIEHANKLLNTMVPGPARQELENIRDSLRCAWDFILPDDFMAGIVEYSLGIRKSDIKKVTEDMLYSAAVLADRGHGAPHEYIHGVFSVFNVRDIDAQAWIIYDKRLEEMREEAKARRGGDDAS